MTALVVVLTAVLAIMVLLVAGLLRSHADILRALHSLGIDETELRSDAGSSSSFRTRPGVPEPRSSVGDTAAHDIDGVTPDGAVGRAAVAATRHTTLLAFLSSGCLTCRDFWDAFAGDLELPGTDTRLVIVTQGPEAESASAVQALAPRGVRVLMSSQAWHDYGIPVSPYFLLVDGPSGAIVGEGAAQNWESVAGLLRKSLADAGLGSDARRTKKTSARGAEREADTDEALLAAGIEPGDPRLHHGTDK